MRVLVTGCAGYIGSTLTRYLMDCGCRVIGVDNFAVGRPQHLIPALSSRDFIFHHLDVTTDCTLPRLVRSVDAVVHLAAYVGAPICKRYDDSVIQNTNALSVKNIVKMMSPHQTLVYPNTNSGYGTTDGKTECTEDMELNPISLYGKTKCQGEQFALEHPNSFVFRLATVFGISPRMRFDLLVNDFTARLAQSKNLVLYEPHFMRNYVHVKDVCRAFHHAMTSGMQSGVYNLGHPHCNMNKEQLASKILSELPYCTSQISVGEGRDPDQRNYLVSNQKILQTGFTFQYPLSSGIWNVAELARHMRWKEIQQMSNAPPM